jgi:hypothetical protein
MNQLQQALQGPGDAMPSAGAGSDIDGRIAELKGKMQRLQGMTGPEVNRIRDDFWQEVSQLMSEKRHQDTLRHQQEQLQISSRTSEYPRQISISASVNRSCPLRDLRRRDH